MFNFFEGRGRDIYDSIKKFCPHKNVQIYAYFCCCGTQGTGGQGSASLHPGCFTGVSTYYITQGKVRPAKAGGCPLTVALNCTCTQNSPKNYDKWLARPYFQ